jgi:hypothetical protein
MLNNGVRTERYQSILSPAGAREKEGIGRKDFSLLQKRVAFAGEQPLFFVEAASLAREFPVGTDDAVTWHDDRNGVQ